MTREMFTHDDLVSPEDHAAWCARRCAEVPLRCWIGEVDGVPIGVVRLEDESYVSITVAPEMRGQGYARPLLMGVIAEARALGLPTLHAKIKHRNTRSVSTHLRAGFQVIDRDSEYIQLAYDLSGSG